MTPETEEQVVEDFVASVKVIEAVHPDEWFALSGQEFGIVEGRPVAFFDNPRTYMTEGGPFDDRTIPLSRSLLTWMKMKRAVIANLLARMNRWIDVADLAIQAENDLIKKSYGQTEKESDSSGAQPE